MEYAEETLIQQIFFYVALNKNKVFCELQLNLS